MAFADHFSHSAKSYAAFRPLSAASSLWLASVVPNRAVAWDCATGNGQAAVDLWRPILLLVVGTDPASLPQLSNATGARNVAYAAMTGERAAMRTGSVSVVTVAQALHWMDRPAFFDEARRVLISGLVAVWSYALAEFDNPRRCCDATILNGGTVLAGRNGRSSTPGAALEFPFDELRVPLTMEVQWSLDHLAGYISTWSACATGEKGDRVESAANLSRFDISRMGGLTGRGSADQWPLAVRVGRAG